MPIDDVLEKIKGSDENKPVEETKLETDFDKLLAKLNCEESRNKALLMAVEKGAITDRKYLEMAIELYVKGSHSNLQKAAELYEKLGNYEKAIELYVNLGWFDSAAKIAEKINNIEKAIVYYCAGQNYYEAGRVAEKMNEFDRAIKIYEQGASSATKDVDRKIYYIAIANAAKKKGDLEKAIIYYVSAREYVLAGELAEKKGEYDKAIIYYDNGKSELAEKAKKLLLSKPVYKKYKMLQAENRGEYDKAFTWAESLCDKEKMQLYKSLWELLSNKPQKE